MCGAESTTLHGSTITDNSKLSNPIGVAIKTEKLEDLKPEDNSGLSHTNDMNAVIKTEVLEDLSPRRSSGLSHTNDMRLIIKREVPEASILSNSITNSDENVLGLAIKTEMDEDVMQLDITVDDRDIDEIMSICAEETPMEVPSTKHKVRVNPETFSPKLKKIIKENSGHYGKRFHVNVKDDGVTYRLQYNRKGKIIHVTRMIK